jgi:hypothetical protein
MFETIHAFLDRVRALATSAVTYLSVGSASLVVVQDNVDIPVVNDVVATVAAILLGTIAVVRRVTPAAKGDRGLV